MRVIKNMLSVIFMILWVMLVWQALVRSYKPDFMLLWLIAGFPFGIGKMFAIFIPGKHDIATSLMIVLLNVICGGFIGGMVLISKVIKNISEILTIRV